MTDTPDTPDAPDLRGPTSDSDPAQAEPGPAPPPPPAAGPPPYRGWPPAPGDPFTPVYRPPLINPARKREAVLLAALTALLLAGAAFVIGFAAGHVTARHRGNCVGVFTGYVQTVNADGAPNARRPRAGCGPVIGPYGPARKVPYLPNPTVSPVTPSSAPSS